MPDDRAAAAVSDLRTALESLRGALDTDEALDRAIMILEDLDDRFRRPHAPWLAAVCGPTGAGKSHLVNFLAGAPVTPSSYRRPSTVAPVLVGREEQLRSLESGGFMVHYRLRQAPDGVTFSEGGPAGLIYLTPAKNPAWLWPQEMVIVDTPDFDSVRLENEKQAFDLARRADVIILVAHQAKYADQSTWDFLSAETGQERPLLLILNRVTAAAAVGDFKDRLRSAGLEAQVIAWPEEVAVGQAAINVAREELTGWLTGLGRRGRELTADRGRKMTARLGALIRAELTPPLTRRRQEVETGLKNIDRITRQWLDDPRGLVSLNLPGETRESLMKGLTEVVSRSDLWAKPRRWLALPFEALEKGVKRLFGRDGGRDEAEKKLLDSVNEAGREALVTAVRGQGRALAEAAGLPSPQVDLDYSPEEIRRLHEVMTQRMDEWLKAETERLLAGLPLGQKAVFYLVQVIHVGLVGGLMVQTGGIPGTETLVSGALGPVISKLTGAVISRENLASFEERAAERHRQELAAVFEEQGQRYRARLEGELKVLSVGRALVPSLETIEKEARRTWA